jgi:hypothetical protein
LWSAAPWIPPSSLGFGTYDPKLAPPYSADYLMPIALLGHVTFWSELTQLSSAEEAETAWWLAWYKAHRAELGGVVYEDTAADPIDGTSWAVLQPWSGDRGYVFAFRQNGGPDSQAIALQGVDPSRTYNVVDVRSGSAVGSFTGAQLQRGLPLSLPAPYSAKVLAVTPAT